MPTAPEASAARPAFSVLPPLQASWLLSSCWGPPTRLACAGSVACRSWPSRWRVIFGLGADGRGSSVHVGLNWQALACHSCRWRCCRSTQQPHPAPCRQHSCCAACAVCCASPQHCVLWHATLCHTWLRCANCCPPCARSGASSMD